MTKGRAGVARGGGCGKEITAGPSTAVGMIRVEWWLTWEAEIGMWGLQAGESYDFLLSDGEMIVSRRESCDGSDKT
jgi:hypothetical protein